MSTKVYTYTRKDRKKVQTVRYTPKKPLRKEVKHMRTYIQKATHDDNLRELYKSFLRITGETAIGEQTNDPVIAEPVAKVTKNIQHDMGTTDDRVPMMKEVKNDPNYTHPI